MIQAIYSMFALIGFYTVLVFAAKWADERRISKRQHEFLLKGMKDDKES